MRSVIVSTQVKVFEKEYEGLLHKDDHDEFCSLLLRVPQVFTFLRMRCLKERLDEDSVRHYIAAFSDAQALWKSDSRISEAHGRLDALFAESEKEICIQATERLTMHVEAIQNACNQIFGDASKVEVGGVQMENFKHQTIQFLDGKPVEHSFDIQPSTSPTLRTHWSSLQALVEKADTSRVSGKTGAQEDFVFASHLLLSIMDLATTFKAMVPEDDKALEIFKAMGDGDKAAVLVLPLVKEEIRNEHITKLWTVMDGAWKAHSNIKQVLDTIKAKLSSDMVCKKKRFSCSKATCWITQGNMEFILNQFDKVVSVRRNNTMKKFMVLYKLVSNNP